MTVSWAEKKSNEEILRTVNYKREINIKIIKQHRHDL